MLNGLDFLLAALAAIAAGAVNALAGGGTLITFPMFTFFRNPCCGRECDEYGGALSRLFWRDSRTME